MNKRENATVAHEMKQWFIDCLGCVAGAREFTLGRYAIVVLDELSFPDGLVNAYEQFVADLQAYRHAGCLFVFNIPSLYAEQNISAHQVLQTLATYMALLTDVSAHTLLHGGNFNKKLTLKCPVTGLPTLYEDFDAIAFCPQAHNKTDPLYDPLMAAPYPCVNFNSDVFGFALLVRDSCRKRYHCEVYELHDLDLIAALLARCGAMWQRIAKRTIMNYIEMTDTALCPTYLADDDQQWYAYHQDPAFAETAKQLFAHDMPSIYTEKVIAMWMRFFKEGIHAQTLSVTQPGSRK